MKQIILFWDPKTQIPSEWNFQMFLMLTESGSSIWESLGMSELWIIYRSTLAFTSPFSCICSAYIQIYVFTLPQLPNFLWWNPNMARACTGGEAVLACCCLPTGEMEQWQRWTCCSPNSLGQRALAALIHSLVWTSPAEESHASLTCPSYTEKMILKHIMKTNQLLIFLKHFLMCVSFGTDWLLVWDWKRGQLIFPPAPATLLTAKSLKVVLCLFHFRDN